eukprot:6690505-Pyramimonas_sp.AAC.1
MAASIPAPIILRMVARDYANALVAAQRLGPEIHTDGGLPDQDAPPPPTTTHTHTHTQCISSEQCNVHLWPRSREDVAAQSSHIRRRRGIMGTHSW